MAATKKVKRRIFFSHQLNSGKSPSTLSSRLLSLSRFIDYLRVYNSHSLPNASNLQRLLSIIRGIILSSFIRGIILSLNMLKKKRQQSIMTKNRNCYTNTVKALEQWRKRSELEKFTNHFDEYKHNVRKQLSTDDYVLMRDFCITELTIPNGIRPGVISGAIIQEVDKADSDITPEGYHKLMVSSHKTGYIQAATIFIYPAIFAALKIFAYKILNLLPHYIRKPHKLSPESFVFQTYFAHPLPSSRVTSILRNRLSQMGISFSGTITDLRKAAATLTGKHNPKLHDMMSAFLGHSRWAHEHYYKINLGHDGLTEAFNNLEIFQTYPDANFSHCRTTYNNNNTSSSDQRSYNALTDSMSSQSFPVSVNQSIGIIQSQDSLDLSPFQSLDRSINDNSEFSISKFPDNTTFHGTPLSKEYSLSKTLTSSYRSSPILQNSMINHSSTQNKSLHSKSLLLLLDHQSSKYYPYYLDSKINQLKLKTFQLCLNQKVKKIGNNTPREHFQEKCPGKSKRGFIHFDER